MHRQRRLVLESLEPRCLLSVSSVDINTANESSDAVVLGVIEDTAIAATSLAYLEDSELWAVGEDGHELLYEFNGAISSVVRTGGNSGSWAYSRAVELNGSVYFYVSIQSPNTADSHELWATDGTSDGTRMIKRGEGLGSFLTTAADKVIAFDSRSMHFVSNDEVIETVPIDSAYGPAVSIGDHAFVFQQDESTESGLRLWFVDGNTRDIRVLDGFKNRTSEIVKWGDFFLIGNGTPGTFRHELVVFDPATGDLDFTEREFSDMELRGGSLFTIESGGALWQQDNWESEPFVVADESVTRLHPLGDGVIYTTGAETTNDPSDNSVWFKNASSGSPEKLIDVQYASVSDAIPYGDSQLMFTNRGDEHYSLWTTDGTFAGTQKLREFAGGRSSLVALVGGDDSVFFLGYEAESGQEVWRSAGTVESTALAADLAASKTGDSRIDNIVAANDAVYFIATDSSGASRVWQSTGEPESTKMFRKVNSETVTDGFGSLSVFDGVAYHSPVRVHQLGPSGEYKEIADINGRHFFPRPDGTFLVFRWIDGGLSVNEIDSQSEIREVTSIDDGFSVQGAPVELNGIVYFVAIVNDDDGTNLYQLWRTDASSEGTFKLADFDGGWDRQLVATDDYVFFASDKTVHRTDGTVEGTMEIPDARYSSNFGEVFATLPGFVLYQRTDGSLWRSDGRLETPEGTSQVYDFTPRGGYPRDLKQLGDVIYFNSDSPGGRELWSTDGTAEGTRMIADVNPGPNDSDPEDFVRIDNRVFFAATHDDSGREVYYHDIDTDRVGILTDLVPGTDGSSPSQLTAALGSLFFVASTDDIGEELRMFRPTNVDSGDWHHDAQPTDVDRSGEVSPLDALIVINELTNRDLSSSRSGVIYSLFEPSGAIDVNDDGVISPLDALLAINELGRPASALSELASLDVDSKVQSSSNAYDAIMEIFDAE